MLVTILAWTSNQQGPRSTLCMVIQENNIVSINKPQKNINLFMPVDMSYTYQEIFIVSGYTYIIMAQYQHQLLQFFLINLLIQCKVAVVVFLDFQKKKINFLGTKKLKKILSFMKKGSRRDLEPPPLLGHMPQVGTSLQGGAWPPQRLPPSHLSSAAFIYS